MEDAANHRLTRDTHRRRARPHAVDAEQVLVKPEGKGEETSEKTDAP
jgi:hypothetical protein